MLLFANRLPKERATLTLEKVWVPRRVKKMWLRQLSHWYPWITGIDHGYRPDGPCKALSPNASGKPKGRVRGQKFATPWPHFECPETLIINGSLGSITVKYKNSPSLFSIIAPIFTWIKLKTRIFDAIVKVGTFVKSIKTLQILHAITSIEEKWF